MSSKYKIVRFRHDKDWNITKRIVKKNLTLDEAQSHCQRKDTHGTAWFDGFTEQ